MKQIKNCEKELKKIIYFDENSATDLIYIKNGGNIQEVFKSDKENKKEIDLGLNGDLGSNFKLFSILKAKISGEGNISYNKHSDNLLSQIITNTVITDYLKISEDEKIIKFEDVVVYAYPNSLAYFKLITPYMAMTEGKVEVDSDFSINIALMDSALEKAKGYYEMIVERDNIKSILRFNLTSFRNNYSLADLVKMRLTFHAIQVGSIAEEVLSIDKEFSLDDSEITGFDLSSEKDEKEKSNKIYVYDVIMAGIFQ